MSALDVHMRMMREALAQARLALAAGEVPVGAVVARDEEIVARAHNEREQRRDPTAHAEMLALRRAAQILGSWRLTGCTLYVTLEPCPMCAGAIRTARLACVWFGADDPAAGCTGTVYRLTEDPALAGPAVPAYGGLLAQECAELLEAFFQTKRAAEQPR